MDDTLVVGLGNPGYQYEKTRHNVGFLVVDLLAQRWKKEWLPGRGRFLFLKKRVRQSDIVLLKPLTYMNLSGLAVREAQTIFGVLNDRLLVVMDDVALPLGLIRIRPGGSDGGHNGLASVIGELGTDQFARCRCGIGVEAPVPGKDLADFVLSPFREEEMASVTSMVTQTADAVELYCREGLAATMGRFNNQPGPT